MNGWVRTKAMLWLGLLSGLGAACVNGDTVNFGSDLSTVGTPDGGRLPTPPTEVVDTGRPPGPAWADAGLAPDAADWDDASEGDASLDAQGYGWIRVTQLRADAQYDAGAMVSAYFTREPHQSCVVQQLLGPCRMEQCAFAAGPVLISPGDVQVAGDVPCVLSAQSAGGYARCLVPELWNVSAQGQKLRVTGSGAEFPAFTSETAAPSSYVLSEPQAPGIFGRTPLSFRWVAEAVGEMEITLGQRSGCSGDFPRPTRMVCTVPAQAGAFELTQELLTALDDVHCLTATFQQRVASTQRIEGYRLDTSVEVPALTSFEFAERDGGRCEGEHAPCSVFTGDDPARCVRHGCTWQAGACAGIPHPCGNVTLAECGRDAGAHAGCGDHQLHP